MKVLLITDYFYPFTPGGAEWSVYELAQSLKKKRIEAAIVTINYGAKAKDVYRGIKINRIPFFKKLKNLRSVVNPVWQNNPVFFLFSAYHLVRIIRAENPRVLNVHGKFLIPPAIFAGFITGKPVVVTIRDKQILCGIGKCFFTRGRYKSCGWREYLTGDLPWFYQNYVKKKNVLKFAYVVFGAIWTKVANTVIKFFAKRGDKITSISNSQMRYLEANGFKNVQVIYNTANFTSPKVLPSETKTVLFVGKLSKGKGIELLLEAAKDLLKEHKINFLFAGNIESQKIKDRLREKVFKNHIKILGSVAYYSLPALYRKASVVIMPSIYPESFGRVALEALSFGTPVVVTNTGALPEIVEDRVIGRVIRLNEADLKEAVLDVVKNEEFYKNNIKKQYLFLKKKFHDDPIKQHLQLYQSLLK